MPKELKFGSFRGVTGTAMFSRSISPKVGRKLLINGLPAARGLPFFPVANKCNSTRIVRATESINVSIVG